MSDSEAVLTSLHRVLRPEFVDVWLDRPNRALGGVSPRVCLERGEEWRVERLIAPLLEMGAA